MTREEQVDWLCRLRSGLNNGVIFTPWNKEFTEALTGILEQEFNGDCVNRQMVLDQTYLWSKDEFLRVTNPFDYLRKRINSLPPVTAESKTGHWEWLTEDKYRCSNCNYETRVDECMNKPMYDFCPFCGARMFDTQESEDEYV